jgi:GDPmannose 4,6-dehydratase
MRTALVTGITGQDGFYLAKLLLDKGYHVIGTFREKIHTLNPSMDPLQDKVEFIYFDMFDQRNIASILDEYRPAEIYNLAACSSGAGMFVDPVGLAEVNGLAVTRILEAIREVDCKIRFCQASSSEVFGAAVESPQTESTFSNPRSPYGAAKSYADSMVRIYRQHYQLFACSAILFNHESPRRGLGFVTRKITHEAARIKLGLSKKLHLGNLDARRDWGFAGDYVHAMWLMLQQQNAEDFVLATGELHTVREVCELAFSRLGLNYRDHVFEDPLAFRPGDELTLIGSAKNAYAKLNWKPQINFQQLVQMMVDSDLFELKKLNLESMSNE